MKIHPPAALAILAAALALSMSAVTAAQDSPPGRTAQLSYVSGSVWLEPSGTQNWIAARLNRPMTVGDRLWADRDSRAELNIGDAVIRLASFTGFSFLNLDQLTAQMQVTAGTVIVHVYGLADGEQDEIDTPNLALSLERPGIYRVEVSDSGDTTIVKVIDGQVLASGGGKTYTVRAQQSVTFTGTTTLSADYALLGAPDAFDDWSMSRDREEAKAAATVNQYVSPYMVGASELAGYGSWQSTQWGYAWFPVVPVGWAPYSLGHWVWIFPWGWTWVDEEPWGFAPFHYGRWGRSNGGWCWIPGPRRVRPIYAPALVAFTRSRIGVRAGSRKVRPVGWLALGPRDVYLPGYAASRSYVRSVNLANSGALTATMVDDRYHGRPRREPYANRRVPGAITAVPRSVFTTGQPVASHRIVVPRHGATRMRFSSTAPAITPVKASVLGPSASHAFSPPRRLIDRPVVARLAPSRAPVPFAAQQVAIRANRGHPLSAGQWAHLRPNRPAVPVRLAGAAVHEPPGRSGATVPAPQRSPAFQPPAVRANRPPWLQGGADHRAAGHPVPSHIPRFERPRPERIPRIPSVPRVRTPPRIPSVPRIHSPPPRAETHFPSYHRSPPARSTPAPRYQHSGPQPEARHPFRFRAAVARPAGLPGWRAAPMYRAQPSPADSVPGSTLAPRNNYEPPAAPPPMYRPVRSFAGATTHREFVPHQIAAPMPAPTRPMFRPPARRAAIRR